MHLNVLQDLAPVRLPTRGAALVDLASQISKDMFPRRTKRVLQALIFRAGRGNASRVDPTIQEREDVCEALIVGQRFQDRLEGLRVVIETSEPIKNFMHCKAS